MGIAHENLSRVVAVEMGDDRAFGLVFSAVLAGVGFWPLTVAEVPGWWALLISVILLGISLIKPSVLQPLHWVWFQLGRLLHRLTNPLILGVIYFIVLTPVALLMRLLGKVPLRMSCDRRSESYWNQRNDPPTSLHYQF